MTTRLSYEVMRLGNKTDAIANHLQRADDLWSEIKAARETLMRCSAQLQAIVCDLDDLARVDPAIKGRMWSAWQRTEAAVKYADDAVMLLNAASTEPVMLAESHHVAPFIGDLT